MNTQTKKPKDNIFISFSGDETRAVARIIKEIITSIFPEAKANIQVFFSEDKIGPGAFKGQILENMRQAKFAISILSPENKNAPWLQYEAGYLSLAVALNDGAFMPFLFCRNRKDVESTISDLQSIEYQRGYNTENFESLKNLMFHLNSYLSPENRVPEKTIKSILNEDWKETEGQLNDLAYNVEHLAAANRDKLLASKDNDSISISSLEGSFETKQQTHVRIADSFTPKTPIELEEKFEEILNTQIPRRWLHQDADDKRFNATKVISISDSTRFSTFVVFTDGERIVLFDRAKDPGNTNVTNDRYDVFGSVQFENRTIKKKIKNQDFLNSAILKVEDITGIAIEENQRKKGDKKETAVMCGVCVYLPPETLELATHDTANGEIVIYSLDVMSNMRPGLLTSKAALGRNHLTKALNRN